MNFLPSQLLSLISGGNAFFSQSVTAIEVSVQIYQGNFDSIDEATKGYAQIGRALSEAIFNALHPNVLGKMHFTAADFQTE